MTGKGLYMMYEEFNRISGQTADRAMYENEIEPLYMAFDELSKEAVAVMYWGMKKGAYALFLKGCSLVKEKMFLDKFVSELISAGLVVRASEIANDWNARKRAYIGEVNAMLNA